VVGDIVNLSTSQISIVPADMFLLSGDAIVNESMLTGESVPVSKIPAKDSDLVQWKEEKAESAKSFLYGGTRVVRIRGAMTADGKGRPALAMIARTGMATIHKLRSRIELTHTLPQASIPQKEPLSVRCYSPSQSVSSFIGTLCGSLVCLPELLRLVSVSALSNSFGWG
jgi:magnesium-transporting ATPase (P-type)